MNCVAFGYIETRLTEATDTKDHPGQGQRVAIGMPGRVVDMIRGMIPLGRPGTPEAADGVYLFCAPESSFVSGQVMIVGGSISLLRKANMVDRPIWWNELSILEDISPASSKPNICPQADWEKARIVPRAFWEKAGAAGILGLSLPEEYGGVRCTIHHDAVLFDVLGRLGITGFGIPRPPDRGPLPARLRR